MDTLKNLTAILKRKENLTKEQIKISIDMLVSEKVEFSEKESFLISFSQKGETISEIASFIDSFLELSKDPEYRQKANARARERRRVAKLIQEGGDVDLLICDEVS